MGFSKNTEGGVELLQVWVSGRFHACTSSGKINPKRTAVTTINTIGDLLRTTRENEDFRAVPECELLTEEMLALTQTVSVLSGNVTALTNTT